MTQKGQVAPLELLFAQNWEDPESDRAALRIQPGDVLMTITSGGCNTIGFLLDDPAVIYAVDINSCQSHLLELKVAAIRNLDHGRCLMFLGVRHSEDRWETFRSLEESLSKDGRAFWRGNEKIVREGILFNGKYERFVGLFRQFLRQIQGNRRVDSLFDSHSLEDQKKYFDDRWDTRRFRAIFSLFFNKHVLARRGLSADYFKFDDGDASFAKSFYRRAKHVMTEIPIQSNYFLAGYLLGRYRSEGTVPDYLRAESYTAIQQRLDRITIVTADAKHWMAGREADSIDCLSLSNICELMDLGDTEFTFREVARCARDGARLCFRNLMVPRAVPDRLADQIRRNTELSHDLLKSDRSFVYGKVDALEVFK